MADMIFPEKLDDDVREAWEWWLEQEDGGAFCPSTKSDMIGDAECDRFCAPIFPHSNNKARENTWGGTNCPCARLGTKTVRAHIEAVLNGK